MIRWAVFASGYGSNFENMLQCIQAHQLSDQSVVAFVCDQSCRAKEIAKEHRIALQQFQIEDPRWQSVVLEFLNQQQVNSIFLLGFMRILPADFLEKITYPIFNLHPSLLPKHKGLKAIQKAYEQQDSEIGISIHQVVETLDSGAVVHQKAIMMPKASLEAVEQAVHRLEHSAVCEFLRDLSQTQHNT